MRTRGIRFYKQEINPIIFFGPRYSTLTEPIMVYWQHNIKKHTWKRYNFRQKKWLDEPRPDHNELIPISVGEVMLEVL